MKYTIDDIDFEKLSSNMQSLEEAIGKENFLQLVLLCGGESIYIPQIDCLVRGTRNQRIVAEFDGGNYKDLARKYSLTIVRIRSIINDDYKGEK